MRIGRIPLKVADLERVVAPPSGRTRLEGTAWYHHGLGPAGYWRLWSDAIFHPIHARVLGHVKDLAKGDPTRRILPRE